MEELWKRKKPASFFNSFAALSNNVIPPSNFDKQSALKAINNGYIDYFQGRCIKCDLSEDLVNPRGYDRDEGQGAFQSVVDYLRSSNTLS